MPNHYLFALMGFLTGIILTYALMIRRQAKLQAELELNKKLRLEEQAFLKTAQAEFQAAFQNLAQEILETKASRLTQQNYQQLHSLLEPLRLRLLEFQEKVENTHRESMIKIGTLEQVGLTMSA